MAEVKWIKIVTDIFDDEKVLLVESMPDADAILVIWFKLLCLAGKTNTSGVLLLNDKIPYTDEMLATIFRRNINTVRLALQTFEQFGMIEIVNNTITIPNWNKHQSLDQLEKRRERQKNLMRDKRAKQKMLANGEANGEANSEQHVSFCEHGCEANVSPLEEEGDKEGEREREKEKDIEKKKHIEKKNISAFADCTAEAVRCVETKKDVFRDYAGDDKVLLEALRDFEAMRKKIKAPLTDKARKMFCTELDKLNYDNEKKTAAIKQSVLCCWKSVYPLKDTAAQSGVKQTVIDYSKSKGIFGEG